MGADCLCSSDQRISVWLSDRPDLYRPHENSVCAGAELLFLSGGAGGLSHWLFAGSAGRQKLWIFFLCDRIFIAVRLSAGTSGLRMAVPFRAGAGSAASDSIFQETEKSAGAQISDLDEISDPAFLCHFTAADSGGYGGAGQALVLPVYLSLGYIDGRSAACTFSGISAGGSRRTVCLENGDFNVADPVVSLGIPAFLQISLPPGGGLRPVSSGFFLPAWSEGKRLCPLREVPGHLSGRDSGMGAAQQPGMHPMRKMCPGLPYRGCGSRVREINKKENRI